MSGGSGPGEQSIKSGGKGKRVKRVSSEAEKENSKDNENIGILVNTEKGRSAILGVGMGINAAGAGSGGESDKKSLWGEYPQWGLFYHELHLNLGSHTCFTNHKTTKTRCECDWLMHYELIHNVNYRLVPIDRKSSLNHMLLKSVFFFNEEYFLSSKINFVYLCYWQLSPRTKIQYFPISAWSFIYLLLFTFSDLWKDLGSTFWVETETGKSTTFKRYSQTL